MSEKHIVSNDGTTLVDPCVKWHKIQPDTPRGCKMQLIDEGSGVAVYGVLTDANRGMFTHYRPLPTFQK